MRIEYLREFVELAKSLNFSKTANKLFISRTTLSRHIGSIEAELGVDLFIRSTHNVQLTEMGEMLLKHFTKIIEQYDAVLKMISISSNRGEAVLRIGFLDAAVRKILIPGIQRFKVAHPNTKLEITSYELGELSRALQSDKVTIALTIIKADSEIEEGMEFVELYSDGLSAMVPSGSPLASKTAISFSELLSSLSGYNLILPDADCYPAISKILNKIATDAGYQYETLGFPTYTRIDSASILVESGSAVTILPKHCEVFEHSRSRFVDLEDQDALIKIGILWKSKNQNPVIRSFVNELCRFVKI